jgi:hypothetical protein
MTQHFNDNGDFRYTNNEENPQKITIRTTCEFHVAVDSQLVGPDASTSRKFDYVLNSGDEIEVYCDEKYTITVKDLPHRGEVNDGESLVEVLEPHEMSLYDRLRHEMLEEVSRIAHKNELDSYEDDGDLGWEEDDGDIPLTPHEYTDMAEEFLKDNPYEDKVEDDSPAEQETEPASTAELEDSSDTMKDA